MHQNEIKKLSENMAQNKDNFIEKALKVFETIVVPDIIKKCPTCKKDFSVSDTKHGRKKIYCSSECSHEKLRKTIWPTKETLIGDIQGMSWLAIGKKYGVSDNAVRKWAKHYQIIT
jgi:hypothetical protein